MKPVKEEYIRIKNVINPNVSFAIQVGAINKVYYINTLDDLIGTNEFNSGDIAMCKHDRYPIYIRSALSGGSWIPIDVYSIKGDD